MGNAKRKIDKVNDDAGGEHADVVLEGCTELEDTKEGCEGKDTGNDASSDRAYKKQVAGDIVVININLRAKKDRSDNRKDTDDSVINDANNGKDNDCAAEVAAASACLSVDVEVEKRVDIC